MLPTPSTAYATNLDATRRLNRLEGWYTCTQPSCGLSFFRNLSPDSSCPNVACGRTCPPVVERVSDSHVDADYSCPFCNRQWHLTVGLAKKCNMCSTCVMPGDPKTAYGVGYASCAECGTLSYFPRARVEQQGQCLHCKAVVTVTVVCSQQRLRLVRQLRVRNVIANLHRSFYVPGTQRTHRVGAPT